MTGHDDDFKTYVIQFGVRPKYKADGKTKLDGGTTFMKVWATSPGVTSTKTVEVEIADSKSKCSALSPSEMDIYKLLNDDLAEQMESPTNPAKHKYRAAHCIQYLLTQMLRFLRQLPSLHGHRRPRRTHPVFLQWANWSLGNEWTRELKTKQFGAICQAVNSSYFSDGDRFRIVQETVPLTTDEGLLNTGDGWPTTNTNFCNLVAKYFKLKSSVVALVVGPENNPRARIYRYLWATSDYCNRPHKLKVVPLTGIPDDQEWKPVSAETATVKEWLRNMVSAPYHVNQFVRGDIPLNLFPTVLNPTTPINIANDVELKAAYDPAALWEFLSGIRDIAKQYGVVLDAGSTGTRSLVYRWTQRFGVEPDCKPILPDEMESIDVADGEAKGGLADLWEEDAAGLEERVQVYMQSLIEVTKRTLAVKRVKSMRRVPIYMLATGGMRQFKERNLQGYLYLRRTVTNFLNKSGFLEPTYDTISGEAEGVFAWVDANFAVKKFAPDSGQPWGIVEMGGQTMQLAFSRPNVLGDWGDYQGPLTKVDLGPEQVYHVFTRSWGALGAQAMWAQHARRMVKPPFEDPSVSSGAKYKVRDRTITGTGDNIFDSMLEVFGSLACRDTACAAGDLCMGRLGRGCLLNEVDGLKFGHGSHEQHFIGISSMRWALKYLSVDTDANVATIFTKAKTRYAKTFDQLRNEARDDFKAKHQREKGQNANDNEVEDEMEKKREFLLKEMFTASLVLTIVSLGFGLPVSKYEEGCIKLALIWVRVETQCLEAGVCPTDALRVRLMECMKEYFRDLFPGITDFPWLEIISSAIFSNYFTGAGGRVAGNIAINNKLERFLSASNNHYNYMTNEQAQKLRDGLQWLVGPQGSGRQGLDAPYYQTTNGPAINAAWRDLCFELWARYLSLSVNVEQTTGVTLRKSEDGKESWTRGKMLLHSVQTEAKTLTRNGWSQP